MIAISSLNTYNFMFIMLGLLLHWRPKRFLDGGSQVGAGDLRRADPVPVLWRHRRYPDPGEKWRRGDGLRSDHPCLRQPCRRSTSIRS